MKKTRFLGLAAGLVALLGAVGSSAILELTLDEIVDQSDRAVYGEITERTVHKVVTPESTDYYTTLTIEGREVGTEDLITVDVSYNGGFLNDQEGVWNSEAPSDSETQVGQSVVLFYKWMPEFTGGAMNALYNAHGGLYRTDVGPAGTVVLGRGTGYAIDRNLSLTNLDREITSIRSKRK